MSGKRRLKLHAKIARELRLGVIKTNELSKEDIEDSANIDQLKRSLEDILAKTLHIEETAGGLAVPLALGAQRPNRTLNVMRRHNSLRQRRMLSQHVQSSYWKRQP